MVVVSICGGICGMSSVRVVVIVMQDANRLVEAHFAGLYASKRKMVKRKFIDGT